jgi:hypothetical protein
MVDGCSGESRWCLSECVVGWCEGARSQTVFTMFQGRLGRNQAPVERAGEQGGCGGCRRCRQGHSAVGGMECKQDSVCGAEAASAAHFAQLSVRKRARSETARRKGAQAPALTQLIRAARGMQRSVLCSAAVPGARRRPT